MIHIILKRIYFRRITSSEQRAEIYTDKTRYSAFAGTDVELRLKARGVTEIHLVGVCTDICILHTAVDAYNKGFDIVIHKDGVSSFNLEAHEVALEHFKNSLGAEII